MSLRSISPFLWTLAILLTACTTAAPPPTPDANGWIKGALIVGVTVERNCMFKPFVKTGNAEDTDDGQHQIIGFTPGEVVVAHDGRSYIPERALEDSFVQLGHAKSYHGALCRCPAFSE